MKTCTPFEAAQRLDGLARRRCRRRRRRRGEEEDDDAAWPMRQRRSATGGGGGVARRLGSAAAGAAVASAWLAGLAVAPCGGPFAIAVLGFAAGFAGSRQLARPDGADRCAARPMSFAERVASESGGAEREAEHCDEDGARKAITRLSAARPSRFRGRLTISPRAAPRITSSGGSAPVQRSKLTRALADQDLEAVDQPAAHSSAQAERRRRARRRPARRRRCGGSIQASGQVVDRVARVEPDRRRVDDDVAASGGHLDGASRRDRRPAASRARACGSRPPRRRPRPRAAPRPAARAAPPAPSTSAVCRAGRAGARRCSPPASVLSALIAPSSKVSVLAAPIARAAAARVVGQRERSQLVRDRHVRAAVARRRAARAPSPRTAPAARAASRSCQSRPSAANAALCIAGERLWATGWPSTPASGQQSAALGRVAARPRRAPRCSARRRALNSSSVSVKVCVPGLQGLTT